MSLEAAVQKGDNLFVEEQLRSGADPDERGLQGLTVLMLAAGAGQAQVVEQLLTAGADIFACDPKMGATALHKAAQSGSPDVIALLLEHGAFIDQQTPILGNTPLIDAVLYKNEDAVRLLLARGARTTIRNHWQQTALELAKADKLEAVARLIEARNEADATHVSSQKLIAAVKAGDKEEAKRLLAEGVEVDERSPIIGSLDDNYTPLGIATREGNPELVQLLLQAGANPTSPIGLMQGTSVHEASYFGHAHILRILFGQAGAAHAAKSALAEQGPYNGLTALHDAVWHGHLEAAEVLIEEGAPLRLKTHAGQTPRTLAVRYGYDELAQLLGNAEAA